MTSRSISAETRHPLSKEKKSREESAELFLDKSASNLRMHSGGTNFFTLITQQLILGAQIVFQTYYSFIIVTPNGGISWHNILLNRFKRTSSWKEGRRGTQHPQLPHSLTHCLPNGVVRGKVIKVSKNDSNQQHTFLQ